MGSDESHFNVSVGSDGQSHRTVPPATFEEKGEPKQIRTEVPLLQYQPNALPLGQTGSFCLVCDSVRLYIYIAWPAEVKSCVKVEVAVLRHVLLPRCIAARVVTNEVILGWQYM